MKKTLGLLLLCLGVFSLGLSAAFATPPRYASVHDTPIGINQTHMFMFRTLGDNEGSHFINTTQRFLISQELKTGRVDRIWPLDRSRVDFVDLTDHLRKTQRVEPKIDPLDILDQLSATPLTITARSDWSGLRPQPRYYSVLAEGGIIDEQTAGLDVIVPASDILARIASGMNPFMASLADDPGPVDPITFSADAYSHDLADCYVVEQAANIPEHDVYRLECENGEYEVLSYVIYLTIRVED